MNEFEIIAEYFRPLTSKAAGTYSLQDDAAFLDPAALQGGLVVTTDSLVAGRHFFPQDRAEDIAIKAMGVNLSDIASKGAMPFRYQLAIALPQDWVPDWLAGFVQGLQQVQQDTGCLLLGGDTVGTTGPLTITITMMGHPCGPRMIRRDGAQVGDAVLVSGTIGDAAIGLALRTGALGEELASLAEAERTWFARRYLYPEPRTGLAPLLARYATAAMDISDGLTGDLAKLCLASGVSVRLDPDAIPVALPVREIARIHQPVFDVLVSGGDDYEVLFTAAPSDVPDLVQEAATLGIALHQIGEVCEAGTEPVIFLPSSQRKIFVSGRAFDHFT